jgi:Domain of unknown function (DUF5642)
MAGVRINPANIKRIGREMPDGYEVTSVAGVAAPEAIWGLGPGWTANPAQCATLADPAAGHGRSAQGVSGSGAGGILYAVVAFFPGARALTFTSSTRRTSTAPKPSGWQATPRHMSKAAGGLVLARTRTPRI